MPRIKYTYNEKRKEWATLVYDGTLTKTGAKHRKRIASKKSSADLEKKVAAFKLSLESPEPSLVTFGDYSKEWLEVFKSTKELNTQKMYSVSLKYLEPLSCIRLADLKRANIQKIINDNSDHPKTCKNIKLTFTQVIKSAVRDRYLPFSALDELTVDISLPKYQKPLKRALNASEIKAIKTADLAPMKRAFITVIYYCGLRRGEALALTVDDIKDGYVTVNKTLIFDGNKPIIKPYPKSDRGVRSVPLPAPAKAFLNDYTANCTGNLFKALKTPLMTETSYRRMWDSIIHSLNKVSDEPITLTAHIFRHNYCSRLCYQIPKLSTKKIAQLMGDTEAVVLGVYSHILEEKEDIESALKDAFPE